MRSVTFRCPLCRALGRLHTLVAELDAGPSPPTVINLQGCEHADGFGHLDKLTLEQEWRPREPGSTCLGSTFFIPKSALEAGVDKSLGISRGTRTAWRISTSAPVRGCV
jgi:hypothetical protein